MRETECHQEFWHARAIPSRRKGANLPDDLLTVKLTGKTLGRQSKERLFEKLCLSLKEQQCRGNHWTTVDKAFACAWLNNQQAVVGTKCNKLLLLSFDGRGIARLPALQEVPLPKPQDRPNADLVQSTAFQNALWSVSMLLRYTQNRPEGGEGGSPGDEGETMDSAAGMIATAMSSGETRPTPFLAPGQFHTGQGGIQTGNCGIHCIATTPGRDMLACGGFSASDCQTYKVEEDAQGVARLTPAQTLIGHKDWIFGAAWITDRHVVTGSRDTSLKLWHVDPDSQSCNAVPLRSRLEENGKVRDVKYLAHMQRVASLAVNGTVQISDPHLDKVSLVATPFEREVVCMAAAESVLAVGSQNHITLVDPRQAGCLPPIPTAELNHGVRSLAFCHNLLSVGSGHGKVHFYDLRNGKYLEKPQTPLLGSRSYSLQTGDGHLVRNNIYLEHFEGMEVKNACYSHAWDPAESRLLAVGGPLAFGLSGNYAAIWS